MTYPHRVLLIDDDDDDRYLFRLGLNEFDSSIELHCERDCEVAIQKLAANDIAAPDCFFLDWNMPKMSGRECLIAIRAMPQYNDVPIIVQTTCTRPEVKQEAELFGAAYFYNKPSNLKELAQRFEQIFHNASIGFK